MASSLHHLAAGITERSKTLINNDLKKILKEEGLSQTGNKAALQTRVISLINSAVNTANTETLRRLHFRVQNHGEAPTPTSSSSPTAPTLPNPAPPAMNAHTPTNGYSSASQFSALHQLPPPRPAAPSYFFKDSPFFEVRELVLTNITLEASPSHRQNCTRNLIINEQIGARLKSDPSLRLLLFSALEAPLPPFARTDITFPAQIEVRINGDEVKANYKGLKNKPGSTRPADITNFVRISPANYRNHLVVTYALTHKASSTQHEKYNLFVYMVKKHSAADLTKQIAGKHVISKQSVLNEMKAKAADPDIEVGSSVMSLKDPISTLRISIPCRSTVCTHNQCFDAESFLQLQEQAPTWICPICSKTVHFNGLAVDQYVEEILAKVKNADQVTISPTGEWSTEKAASPPRKNGAAVADDSDDDLVEIPDYRVASIKSEAVQTPTYLSTPPMPSREPSAAPRSGTKRKSEVVDLTLSDDDEPPRPAKKVAYRPPTSLPEPSRRYELPPPIPRPSQYDEYSSSYRTPPSGSRLDYPPRPHTPYTRPEGWDVYRPPLPGTRPQPQDYTGSGSGSSRYPAYLGSSP
ncbi:E3 SUMO-protein ligase pli1 [Ascochyta rabiei]|uniref:E3 SUMO-protein ligase pli1 n=1 Tax=Didymella rabiei TaxID=5454 RepID=UPI002202F7D9|nr:E3 SUMO-protein ligase pli1 [Ascochyta rabiei]UPX12220.1 E3 SUMO-protein ligase pli1 [Ascochyta rabiei]